jgi:hypothetical protein
MTSEEAKEILRQLIEFMDYNFGEQSADVTQGLQDVITLIDKQQDEIESLWMLADEMSKSDVSLHEKKILEELDKIFKDKRKIAKVSEA